MAIDVIINDSSCLIDLRKGGLLWTTLLLPFRFLIALPLVETELNDFSVAEWRDLETRGMRTVDLEASQVDRALALKSQFIGLSVYDCFSLALAETTPNAMLLTGDQQLRRRAAEVGIEVHGVLWVSDQIEARRAMGFAELAEALLRLDGDPLVFLPANEVAGRITRLRRKARGL